MEEEKIRKFHCSLETIQLLSETFFVKIVPRNASRQF